MYIIDIYFCDKIRTNHNNPSKNISHNKIVSLLKFGKVVEMTIGVIRVKSS